MVDILLSAVLGADLDIGTKTVVMRAFNKVVWIQNDCKSRMTAIFPRAKKSHQGTSVLSTLHGMIQ